MLECLVKCETDKCTIVSAQQSTIIRNCWVSVKEPCNKGVKWQIPILVLRSLKDKVPRHVLSIQEVIQWLWSQSELQSFYLLHDTKLLYWQTYECCRKKESFPYRGLTDKWILWAAISQRHYSKEVYTLKMQNFLAETNRKGSWLKLDWSLNPVCCCMSSECIAELDILHQTDLFDIPDFERPATSAEWKLISLSW